MNYKYRCNVEYDFKAEELTQLSQYLFLYNKYIYNICALFFNHVPQKMLMSTVSWTLAL